MQEEQPSQRASQPTVSNADKAAAQAPLIPPAATATETPSVLLHSLQAPVSVNYEPSIKPDEVKECTGRLRKPEALAFLDYNISRSSYRFSTEYRMYCRSRSSWNTEQISREVVISINDFDESEFQPEP